MVPNALPLEGFLRWIFLRSEAEMQTLFSLLEDSGIRLSDSWTSRIRVARPGNLFYRRWTYVERVAVTRSEIRIDFNPDTLTPGPFRVDIQFLEQNSLALMASWGQEGFFAQGARAIAVPSPVAGGSALFRALLDRHLAYQNRIDLRSDAFVF